jgi:hypothetical protein
MDEEQEGKSGRPKSWDENQARRAGMKIGIEKRE